MILIPEISFDIKNVCRELVRRSKIGKRFSILVVAEGVKPGDSKLVIKRRVKGSTDPIRLGGVSYRIAEQIENLTGLEARVIILGHLQRGGKPTEFDRILATQFGKKAVDLVMEGKFGYMVSLQGGTITSVPIKSVISGTEKSTPYRQPQTFLSIQLCSPSSPIITFSSGPIVAKLREKSTPTIIAAKTITTTRGH